MYLSALAKRYGFSLYTPFKDLPKEIHLDRQKRDELEQVKQAEKRFDRNAPTNEKSPKSTYDDGEQAILLGLGNNKAI